MKLIMKLLIIFIAGIMLFSGCTQQENQNDNSNNNNKNSNAQVVTLDQEKIDTHLSKAGGYKEAYWERSGFHRNDIETSEGVYNWEYSDNFIGWYQDGYYCALMVLFPFANWDQESCHPEDGYTAEFEKGKGGTLKVGIPCDMGAYKNYLKALVERYDGDGVNDMPNLKVPIKYWEIMNEPSMQGGSTGGMGEELKFFYGTPAEYVTILKNSYEAIKEADPDAKVLHAGIAGMHEKAYDFWDQVYALDVGDYFDIANIHSISTTELREDLYMEKFKTFLEKYGLEDKPIWITEVQFGGLIEVPSDIESFNSLMVRSSIFSLALGADKLFFIENWNGWGAQAASSQLAYQTLVKFMNDFDTIEVILQEYTENIGDQDGLTSNIGQYKITKGTEVFYVLWGDAVIPEEISGTIEIIDIYGNSKIDSVYNLVLSGTPQYIQLQT